MLGIGVSELVNVVKQKMNRSRRAKMKSAKFFPVVTLITAIIVAGGIGWSSAAQEVQSKVVSSTTPSQTSASDELEQYFQKARQDLANNVTEASTQIRKAVARINEDANHATGKAKQLLQASSKELEGLADQVQKGAVKAEQELNNAFSRAHNALAQYYQDQAAKSWSKKATTEAGQDLDAAASHLEEAWKWSETKVDNASTAVVDSAKQVGKKISQGSGWVSAEVSKSIEDLGQEIGKLRGEKKSSQSSAAATVHVQSGKDDPPDLATAIMEVARSKIPAVVHIEVTERREVANPFLPFENDPFFRHFFGIPKKMPKKFKQERVGVGTGMVIDSQGHILTNNHVVGGASKIVVSFSDGNQYEATVVGTDPKTDLGVIKISGKDNFPFVTFGDSDQVQVGQWVVAIGQPRNLAQSVTQGIISAKHRRGITDPSSYQDFLQTDAAINPGNSGGPLLTLSGEVIGVNSAILSESGGFEGIGFAIPSNMAVRIVDQLIKNGKVVRGWMGVNVQDLTPDLAKSFGLQLPKGALIADVTKGGPADKAGMRRGDVILAYEGKEIADGAALRNAVANTSPGQEETVTVWREKKKEEMTLTVGNAEELTKALIATLKDRLGAEVRPLAAQEAEKFGMDTPSGVVIESIDPKGPLAKAGFEVGDAILTVNGQPISGLEGLAVILGGIKPHEKVTLLAVDHRTGQSGSVEVALG
jgi:serine protease Do